MFALDSAQNLRLFVLVFAACLTGCEASHRPFSEAAQAADSLPQTSEYRSFGDSITWGYGLANPNTQAYPVLVASYENVSSFANYARSGDMACDVPAEQIFAKGESPTLTSHSMYTLLIGTNDVIVKGAGPYEENFTQCHQAAMSWLAVPIEYKVLTGDPGMTSTGPGALDKTKKWNTWTTGHAGASVSFTLNTFGPGPIYAWPLIDDASPATYTYSLDGVFLGRGAAMMPERIATQHNTTSSLGFIRIPDVRAGRHVLTFTQTNQGSQGIAIVGAGAPYGNGRGILPRVYAGTIPLQFHNNSKTALACTLADPVCNAYIQHIKDDVALFRGDGLHVALFDTRKFMSATRTEMSDPLHPNAFGEEELSHAVESVW